MRDLPSAPEPHSAPRYRGRFAPSPTGDLHAGSLLAALGSWLLARRAGGEWWVRIEDLDPPREVPGAASRQLQMLAACALVPDAPVVCQSSRHALYEAALAQLLSDRLAFECHCSRSDLAATGGVHRECVARRRRADPAVRLRVPDGSVIGFHDALQGFQQQDVAASVGDFVLRRADGLWAYQLAVVVDDAAQQVTDVVRGADLLDSTPRQILLQRRLGLPTPRYLHLPLVTDAAGRKLSKSEGDAAVDPRRPVQALNAAWQRLGQVATLVPADGSPADWLRSAAANFDPDLIRAGVQRTAASTCGSHL
ncbi:tRNA glutamyl-Q(34) synthetase GluQRS [Lysobacter korlensis]|uniref:Glutamyl-Q tRNA(Asp) synthetase n=1 Tax=Lysobacter korlensis TaxID=553636 RepID=A0ABV6RPI1_9GAMM